MFEAWNNAKIAAAWVLAAVLGWVFVYVIAVIVPLVIAGLLTLLSLVGPR